MSLANGRVGVLSEPTQSVFLMGMGARDDEEVARESGSAEEKAPSSHRIPKLNPKIILQAVGIFVLGILTGVAIIVLYYNV